MEKRRQYRDLPDVELPPELDAKIRVMTEAADRDIAAYHEGRKGLPDAGPLRRKSVDDVTDEPAAYCGSVLRTFLDSGGEIGDADRYLAAVDERRRLLAPAGEGGGELARAVAGRGLDVEVRSVRQPSRLYGHSLVDLLAISNISVLVNVPGIQKFDSAAKTLRDRPEEIDLRIETDGPRAGMWSVVQPQWVTEVRRLDSIGR